MKMNCTIPYTVTVQVANTIKTSTQHHLYLYYQGYRGNLPIYKSVLKHSLPILYCWKRNCYQRCLGINMRYLGSTVVVLFIILFISNSKIHTRLLMPIIPVPYLPLFRFLKFASLFKNNSTIVRRGCVSISQEFQLLHFVFVRWCCWFCYYILLLYALIVIKIMWNANALAVWHRGIPLCNLYLPLGY